jgi:glycosyltransferase involved in cell wall biosynthesis
MISVVIPVYKSTTSVSELCFEIIEYGQKTSTEFEVVLVDDGNVPSISAFLDQIVSRHRTVRVIHLSRNYGQHNATLVGVINATGDIIVTMDDDKQHSVNDFPLLLEQLDPAIDIVYGIPQVQPHGLVRGWLSVTTKRILASSGDSKVIGVHSAFRCFRSSLATDWDNYRQPLLNIDQLLSWKSDRVTSVSVRHMPRQYGTSNYTFSKLIVHGITLLLGFTTWPLRLSTTVGLFCCFISLLVVVFVVVQRVVVGGSVPGFAFLASLVGFLGGIQLLSIGIIGEYVAQIFNRTSDRPMYSIRNVVTSDKFES